MKRILLTCLAAGLALTGTGCTYLILKSSGKLIEPLEIHVATNGNDAWSGRFAEPLPDGSDGPLATLEGAWQRVLETRQAYEGNTWIRVLLRGGVYFVPSTVVLSIREEEKRDARDFGLTWFRPYGSEQVLITGGKAIGGFEPVTDAAVLARLDPASHPHIVQSDLPAQGITDFGQLTPRGFGRPDRPAALELFFQDKPMPLARWPNDGWAAIASVPKGPNGGQFGYSGDRPQRWRDLDDIWLHGYWTWDWADSHEKVASIDMENRIIATEPPHGCYGYKEGGRYYFLNVLEELDSPGEWYLDRATGILYFWPPAPIGEGEVYVSLTETPLIRTEGALRVEFNSLAFKYTRQDAIVSEGAYGLGIKDCEFRNVGNVAVRTKGNGLIWIDGCDISETGDAALVVDGGNRMTLKDSLTLVQNSRISRFGRWVRTYRPGVSVSGVGVCVENNEIFDAPHSAIILHGNEHLIRNNEIHHVCMETNDAGAIYIGRDWSQRGNVIDNNYLHHLGSGDVRAIYLDDWSSDVTVTNNILYQAGMGVCIGGGRDNSVENNFFIECRPAVHVDARGKTWAQNYFDGRLTTLTDRLEAVNYREPPYSERYPELLTLYEDDPAQPKYNRVARNISWNGEWLRLLDGLAEADLQMEGNLQFDHPEFFHISRKTLEPVGGKRPWIGPIKVRHIGPRKPWRDAWTFPVEILFEGDPAGRDRMWIKD